MMRFVNQNGKRRNLPNRGPQFIGPRRLFIVRQMKEHAALIQCHPVKDDLFGIGDQDNAQHLLIRLKPRNLLHIRITHLIGLGRSRL